jgi:hypothetical protein
MFQDIHACAVQEFTAAVLAGAGRMNRMKCLFCWSWWEGLAWEIVSCQ